MTTIKKLAAADQQAWAAYREMRLLLDARVARDLEAAVELSMPDVDVLAAVDALSDRGATPELDTWLVPLVPDRAPSARTAHCVRVAALADRMRWSRSRLSRQLGRMERRDLIARVPCELDGRGDDVELTAAGRQALKRAEAQLEATVWRHFASVLSAEQRTALMQISATLRARLAT
ncbi:MarR family winged helix-turn-helix transcriptional regulator [Micromonospora andamanensis]|uniref:MarR family transcriptional regulator n=1 Tax=Micromonospora andamanensis TaxID=1287068 RepID=A0ABQ4I251_9ACTN|nr:MarR family transcriptional regulator [Micromonospora andamanensis]GIJ11962.1 MarR family transcriptional regulator [Micromonospora andamanensis]